MMTSSMLQKASSRTSRKSRRVAPVGSLGKTETLQLYRTLILVRGAEEKIRQEYGRDEMKTPVHLGLGQEAIVVGVCQMLLPKTKTFGTYRNHALYLAMTQDTDGFFGELYGKMTGPGKGKAGSMHLSAPAQGLLATSAVVATTIPVAVGAALANAYLRSEDFAVVFFGDGAVEEGVFWESLNFACLRHLRVLFVCEDNGLAIHTPTSQRHGFRSIPEALQGFNCHIVSGDGSDLIEVLTSTRQMLKQMEQQPKPGVLHFRYFRLLEHVGPREDFDAGYRRRPTPEEYERLDPVVRFERELRQRGWSQAELDSVREAVDEQLERSVRAAQAAPFPSPAELTTDVWA